MRLRLLPGLLFPGIMLLVMLVWSIGSEENGCTNLISWWIGLGGLVQIWIRILCVVFTGGRRVVYHRKILAF